MDAKMLWGDLFKKTSNIFKLPVISTLDKLYLFHVGYNQQITLASKELLSDRDKNDMEYKMYRE